MTLRNPRAWWAVRGSFGIGIVAASALALTVLGDDEKRECAREPTTTGTSIRGTRCADVIITRGSVKRVFGGKGGDRIYAGVGVKVYGGDGDDRIYAPPEGVRVQGGDGDDLISGHRPIPNDAAPAPSRAETTASTEATSPTGPYATAVLEDSPALYLHLGEASGSTATDSSGNGRNGTYGGTPGYGATGLVPADSDSAVNFSGDDYVSVPDDAAFDLTGASPFSIEAWMAGSSTSNVALIAKMRAGSSYRGWELLRLSSGRLRISLIGSSSYSDAIRVDTLNAVADRNQHHVVLTYDGSGGASGIRFYIDGAAVPTTTGVDSLGTDADMANSVNLGIGQRDGTLRFIGVLDEVAFYGAELASERVAAHYAAAYTGYDSCPAACFLTAGDDQFNGGPGADIVYGGRSNDTLDGGAGDDLLYGGLGDDAIEGGDGNDALAGGHGADGVDGQSGDDRLRGDGTGDTLLDSGGGTDTLSYATGVTPGFSDNAGYPSFSNYRNFPPRGDERGAYVNLGAGVADNGAARYGGGYDSVSGADFEKIVGTAFSDFIIGSSGNNTIYGGGGGDVILGDAGNDTLYGGADGDHLDGGTGSNTLRGDAGSDYCRNRNSSSSCERSSGGGVVLRNKARISVGILAPTVGGTSQLYLTGSNAADAVTATYAPGSPPRVTFSIQSGSAGYFDTNSSAGSGCGSPTTTRIVCTLSTPLDAIVLAGVAGGDTLRANGLPLGVSLMLLGGEGSDSLSGGDLTEDVLVDGPDTMGAGSDRLDGFGADDMLTNNDGADQAFAGSGNDLFLSTSICDGDRISGGADRDNASWARYGGAIEARIAEGVAGRPGAGTGPDCGAEPLDTLLEIEDLEGSSFADSLYGGPGPDQLLGRAGGDTYSSAEGNDAILANSGDLDPTIACGADLDVAVIDQAQYGDSPDSDCEWLLRRDPKYAG